MFVIHHLNGCHGTFGSLVSKNSSSASLSLFHGVASQEAIYDGDIPAQIQLSQSLCRALTDVVEVRCVATHNATDGNDSIYIPLLDHPFSSEDEFETSWHMLHYDVFLSCTVQLQCFDGSIGHRIGEAIVPISNDDAKAHSACRWHTLCIVVRQMVISSSHGRFLLADALDVLVNLLLLNSHRSNIVALHLLVQLQCLIGLTLRLVELASLNQIGRRQAFIVGQLSGLE